MTLRPRQPARRRRPRRRPRGRPRTARSVARVGPAGLRRPDRRSGPGRSWRCSSPRRRSTASRTRRPSRTRYSTVEGATFTDQAAVEAALDDARGANLFSLVTGPLEERIRELPTVAGAMSRSGCPTRSGSSSRADADPGLAGRGAALPGGRRGALFAKLPASRRRAAAALPVVEDRRAASAGLAVGGTLEPVDLDAATRLALARAGRRREPGRAAGRLVTDANGFIVRTRPAAGRRYSASTRRACERPSSSRVRSDCCVACSSAASRSVERVILASETDGTYAAKPSAALAQASESAATPRECRSAPW